MNLGEELNKIIIGVKKCGLTPERLDANSPWDLSITCHNKDHEVFTIKNLTAADSGSIIGFKDQLGPVSQELFCPYPWRDEKKLEASVKNFLNNCDAKIDAGYMIWHKEKPIGHFFLWKAGGNPQSLSQGLNIPELGVAVADKYQGQGWGRLQVEFLKLIAKYLDCDAIELTTALNNANGCQTYAKSGFRETGTIRNPLETDATVTPLPGQANWREEKQMVYILNRNKENEILNYLSLKRKEYGKLAL